MRCREGGEAVGSRGESVAGTETRKATAAQQRQPLQQRHPAQPPACKHGELLDVVKPAQPLPAKRSPHVARKDLRVGEGSHTAVLTVGMHGRRAKRSCSRRRRLAVDSSPPRRPSSLITWARL